jgi:hypothetical protein
MTPIMPLLIIAMDKKPLTAELKERYEIAIKNLTNCTIFLTVDNGNLEEPTIEILPNKNKLAIFSIPLQHRAMVKVILPYSNEVYLPMNGFRKQDYFIIEYNTINPLCIDTRQATNMELKEAYPKNYKK